LKRSVLAATLIAAFPLLAAEPPKTPPSQPSVSVKTRSASAADTVNLKTSRLVDLTHSFDEQTIYWPNSPSSFELKVLSHQKTPGGWFYASNSFSTPEHGGTHMDAPIHFAEGKRSVDEVPVRELVAPVFVIDATKQAWKDVDYRLTAADVKAWEGRHGPLPKGAIVLLRTGWGKRWPDRKSYMGDDTPGETKNLHFPSYGKDAAELLVLERQVAGIGVDTASIDSGARPMRSKVGISVRSGGWRRERTVGLPGSSASVASSHSIRPPSREPPSAPGIVESRQTRRSGPRSTA